MAWVDEGDGGGRTPVLTALLAAVLVSFGAHLVVVGGTARRLRGAAWTPRDLDVVLDGGASSLEAVTAALTWLGAAPPMVLGQPSWSVDTSLGRLDVVEVTSGDRLPDAETVRVAGVELRVGRSA